ncbi:MAG: hypothetical protein GY754_01440 [bacterium]|nr:hypothetical protein [bacterium]
MKKSKLKVFSRMASKTMFAIITLMFLLSFAGCEEGLKDGWEKSVAAPKFTTDNPTAVINTGGKLVSNTDFGAVIYSSDDESDIYYSLDGGTTWDKYLAPIPVKGNGTVVTMMAYTETERHGNSEQVEMQYVIDYERDIDVAVDQGQVQPPVFMTDDPVYSTYSGSAFSCRADMNAVISTATKGADIFYSLDNSTWFPYVEEIPVKGDGLDKTIYAYASKEGMTDSGVVSARYTVGYEQVFAPVITLVYQQYTTSKQLISKSKTFSYGETFSLTGVNGFCYNENQVSIRGHFPYITVASATPGAEIFVEIYEYYDELQITFDNNDSNSGHNDDDILYVPVPVKIYRPAFLYSTALLMGDKSLSAGRSESFNNYNLYSYGRGTTYTIRVTAQKEGMRTSAPMSAVIKVQEVGRIQ